MGHAARGAAKQVTKTTPVVMVGVADPIGAGFVPSLARPGGNLTGVTNIASDHSGKILELLTQVVPNVRSVAVLRNPGNAAHGSLLGMSRRLQSHIRCSFRSSRQTGRKNSTPRSLRSRGPRPKRSSSWLIRCSSVSAIGSPSLRCGFSFRPVLRAERMWTLAACWHTGPTCRSKLAERQHSSTESCAAPSLRTFL